MPSAQVSIWVPIVVGVLGLAGVLGAQLIAGWREDRRWRREQEREEVRWRREQEREDQRWRREREELLRSGREDAYARVVGLHEEWSWVLFPAKESVRRGEALGEDGRHAMHEMLTRVRETLGPVNLHGPAPVRSHMREAIYAKDALTRALLTGESDADELERLWEHTRTTYLTMRTEMRRDAGIDTT
ncbi:MAG TPA: hypothetical protein VGD67_06990 [Pseudonocardiaceae bacterium]